MNKKKKTKGMHVWEGKTFFFFHNLKPTRENCQNFTSLKYLPSKKKNKTKQYKQDCDLF